MIRLALILALATPPAAAHHLCGGEAATFCADAEHDTRTDFECSSGEWGRFIACEAESASAWNPRNLF